MKKCLLNITSCLLALLVVFSSLSFKIASHHCKEEGTTTSYLGIQVKCHKEVIKTCCSKAKPERKPRFTQDDTCCKDELSFVKGVQIVSDLSDDEIEVKHQFYKRIDYTIVNAILQREKVDHSFYDPPNLLFDYQIHFQSFLI